MQKDPTQFATRAKALLGVGWQTKFANATGMDNASVSRWVRGVRPLPEWAWAMLELLEAVKAARYRDDDLTPPRWEKPRTR